MSFTLLTVKTEPVTSSYYRYIFCTEFNIHFHIPKTDRCGICEVFKKMTFEEKQKQPEMVNSYAVHEDMKTKMRLQKGLDKIFEILALIFDMENVTCPRTEIGL